jgi:hypothetical protein
VNEVRVGSLNKVARWTFPRLINTRAAWSPNPQVASGHDAVPRKVAIPQGKTKEAEEKVL